VWLDVSTSIRSHVLMCLALMRELYNKIVYYKSIVDRSIARYTEYREKIVKIMPEKVDSVNEEIEILKKMYRRLDSISIFLEKVLLRLETLITIGDSVTIALAVREVVKEIYRYSKSIPPTLIILIDKLNDISKGLIQELAQHYDIVSVTSPEISKIIDEAKKAANID